MVVTQPNPTFNFEFGRVTPKTAATGWSTGWTCTGTGRPQEPPSRHSTTSSLESEKAQDLRSVNEMQQKID